MSAAQTVKQVSTDDDDNTSGNNTPQTTHEGSGDGQLVLYARAQPAEEEEGCPAVNPPQPLHSTDGSESAPARSAARGPHSKCKSLRRRLFSISTCVTVPFALLLLITFGVILGVSTRIMKVPYDALLAAHEVQVATVKVQLEMFSQRIIRIVFLFASMAPTRHNDFNNTVPNLCSILDNLDTDGMVRALTMFEITRGNIYACAHADTNASSMRQLFGLRSVDGRVDGAYYINSSTYDFQQPLRIWQKVIPDKRSTVEIVREAYKGSPIFAAFYDFLEKKIPTYPLSLSWNRFSPRANVLMFNQPLEDYIKNPEEIAKYNTTRGQKALEVRTLGFTTLSTKLFTPTSGLRLLMLDTTTLNSSDPIVIYNNWGQPTVNDTSSFSTIYDYGTTFMHVSGIKDKLMIKALRHVDFRRLEEKGYSKTVRFRHKYAAAFVTAWRDLTADEMESVVILATPLYDQAGPIDGYSFICLGVLLIVMVAYIVFFGAAMEKMLAKPMDGMATALKKAATTSVRAELPPANCLTLSEVAQLMDAYNGAMKLLRKVDTFIPENARDMLAAAAAAGRESVTVSSMSEQDPPEARTKMEPCTISVVYITPRVFVNSGTSPDIHITTSLATLEETIAAAQLSSMSSQNVAAFESADALVVFLKTLLTFTDNYGGVVSQMHPERCVAYFRCENSAYTHGQPVPPQVRRQAITATRFALALSQELERLRMHMNMPLVHMLVDTTHFMCGPFYSPALQQTFLFTNADRDVDRDIGHLVPKLGLDVAMTEQTAVLVRDAVRQLPCEVITVGREGWRRYQVVLYEPLAGSVTCVPWRHYAHHYTNAFMHMTQGKYREALEELDSTQFIPGIYSGARANMDVRQREGDPLQEGLQGSEWVPSVQVERLSNVCAARIMARNNAPYYREPFSERFLYLLNMPLVGREVPSYRQREEVEAAEADLKAAVAAAYEGALAPMRARTHSAAADDLPASRQVVRAAVPQREQRSVSRQHRHKGTQPQATTAEVPQKSDFRLSHSVNRRKARRSPYLSMSLTTHEIVKRNRYVARTEDGTLFAFSRSSSMVDNCGVRWANEGKTTLHCETSCIRGDCLGPTDTMAFAFFYPFIERADLPPDVGPGPLPDIDLNRDGMSVLLAVKSTEQYVIGNRLFLQDQKCEYLMSLLGFSNDEEGGVVEILEYYPGGTLREMMDRYTCVLPIPTVTHYIASVLLALHYLHGRGIVHGDVRPENVHVSTEAHCKLRGFFANRVLAQRILLLHESCYVCPKVAGGAAATTASDVYSAGLVLLEMLRGAPPWKWAAGTQGRTVGDLQELLDDSHAFRAALASGAVVVAADAADIPRDPGPLLRDLLDRCLHSDPKQRTTAEEAVCLIKKAEGGE